MQRNPAWIGGVTGLVVVAAAILARTPPPLASAHAAETQAPSAVLAEPRSPRSHALFAPACSAVYRMDGCTQPHHAWKA